MSLSTYFTNIHLVPCTKWIHRWEKGYYKIITECLRSLEGTPNSDSYKGKKPLKWVWRNKRFLPSTHTYQALTVCSMLREVQGNGEKQWIRYSSCLQIAHGAAGNQSVGGKSPGSRWVQDFRKGKSMACLGDGMVGWLEYMKRRVRGTWRELVGGSLKGEVWSRCEEPHAKLRSFHSIL